MNLDFAIKTYQFIRKSEDLSEYQKKQIIQFAYDSGDEELTAQYISELIRGEKSSEELRKKYGTFTDEMPKWAADFSELILAMAMYSVEQEETIKEISERLEAVLWQTKSPKPSR